ncbi:MAG: hypothetical protein J6U14_09930 [Bacteroidaceae bacterium]|nr:hypothetical protein [Bacteroidaceae bacterium]
MAVQKIALGINLRKNKIRGNAGFGKYYPEVDRQATLSLRGFAQHMVDHGSRWNRGDLESVLYQITECLPELVAQGVPVQLGNLGIFYPTAQSVKGAGVASVEEMEGLNPNTLIKGIRIRFKPDASKQDNLCGPAFKEACSLELRNIVDTETVTVGGKQRTVQTLIPIATAVAQLHAGTSVVNPGTGGNTGGSGNGGGDNGGGDGGGGDLDI